MKGKLIFLIFLIFFQLSLSGYSLNYNKWEINEEELRSMILDSTYSCIEANPCLLKELMREEVLKKITTEELINGILIRERNLLGYEVELFLKELQERGLNKDNRITLLFQEELIKLKRTQLLKYYWDNSFIDEMIESKYYCQSFLRIIEIHSEQWGGKEEYQEKVYDYLLGAFELPLLSEEINQENVKKWILTINILSSSRSRNIVNYLQPFLFDQTELLVEDKSNIPLYGYISKLPDPPKIKVRVCDIAFVYIMKALDQVVIKGPNSYLVKTNILTKEERYKLISWNLDHHHFNLIFSKLTDSIRDKIKRRIETVYDK